LSATRRTTQTYEELIEAECLAAELVDVQFWRRAEHHRRRTQRPGSPSRLWSEEDAGRQIVGIDLYQRRPVLVRVTEVGEELETVQCSELGRLRP